jgi:hypothetical protein
MTVGSSRTECFRLLVKYGEAYSLAAVFRLSLSLL